MKKVKIIYIFLLSLFWTIGYAQVNDQLMTDKLEISKEKKNEFDNLKWKSDYKTKEVGKPEIPVYRVSYVLPIDAVVTGVTFKKKNKQKLDGSFYLYPVQEPRYTDNSKEVNFTVPDSKIYESNQPYPNKMYEIESDRFLQGYHIVTLLIYPFEYIPKSRTLNYYTNLDYTIQYTLGGNADEIRPLTQTVLRAEQCKEFVKSLVQNTEDVDIFGSNALSIREGKKMVQKSSGVQKVKALSAVDEIVPEYIIITCDSLKSTFQTLADWKTKKGVFTIIKTTEEIASAYSGIDLQEKIRKYIIDAYTKWGGGLYVLLGGDTNIVPARMVLGDLTILRPADRYYASYKGTWNDNGDNVYLNLTSGDVMTTDMGVILGRAPVENKMEATVFNTKVISYERADSIPSAKLNYFNNYLFEDEYLDLSYFNSHINIQTNNNSTLPDNIIRKYIYDNKDCAITTPNSSRGCANGDIELNKSNFISCLNTGANLIGSNEKFHFIYAMHHCSPFSMGTSSIHKHQSLTRDDVSQLTNGNYYQIFMSSGCEPADFSEDCIAERYLNNPNGGGVAFIGNSDQGSYYDAPQCKYFFKALHKTATNSGIGRFDIGSIYQYVLFNTWSTNARLHLLGDPEMPVWTNTPQALSVSVSQPSILLGNQTDTITISNLPANVKAMICIQKGTEIYVTQEVTGNGNTIQIPINFTVDTPGTVYVTVTAHNFLPKELTITANQTPAPNLYISTVDFGDGIVQGVGIGNGDGKNDAGETILLGLGIKNTGVNQANGVTATLNCNSPYIKITGNQVSLGSLSSGITTTGIFSYKIDSLAPEKRTNDKTPIEFSLAIIDVNNVIWKDTFDIDIFNSEMKQGNKSIVYISNNHSTIAANDTVRFTIDLKNIDNAQATGIKATLTANSTYIKSGSCSATPRLYPIIGHFEVKQDSVPFQFVASSAYPSGNENLLAFKLKVENKYGKVWNYDFDLSKPAKVIGLDESSADSTEIDIKWNYSTAYLGYNVYRCNADSATGNPAGNYVKINTDSVTFAYYIDKILGKLTKYLYKVAAISKTGNEGELSDSFLAWTSFSKKKFPLDFSAIRGGITTVDINNDGYKEIFGATKSGYIVGLDYTGKELYNIDGNVTTQGSFAQLQSELWGTPAIGNLYGNGQQYMVDASRNASQNKLYCFALNSTSQPILSWVNDIPNGNYLGSILSNIDNSSDGSLEVVTLCENGQILIFTANGNLLTTIGTPGSFYAGAIAVADFGNGDKEIVMAKGCSIYIWDNNGNPYKGCPNGAFYTNTSGTTFNPQVVVCDIDNDGKKEILATTATKVYAIRTDNTTNTLVPNWNQPNIVTNGSMSVGDLNHDGNLEIVALGTNTISVLKNNGELLPTSPINNPLTIDNLSPAGNPILADVDGNSNNEIIFGSTVGTNLNVYGYNMDLSRVLGFPLKTHTGAYCTPSVSDINNDGKNELVLGVDNWMYIWNTNGKANNVEWGSIFHNQYNTAEYQRTCNTTKITANETWNINHIFCGDLVVESGTLTINSSSTLTMGNSTTITVKSGASLIIDSGSILNANVRALAGSTVAIKNGGKIVLRSNAEFYTETGTNLEILYGSIDK